MTFSCEHNLAGLARLAEQERGRLLQHRVGRGAERMERPLGWPHAAEIGEAREQRHAPLEAPKERGDLLLGRRLGDRGGKLRARIGHMSVRVSHQACGEIGRISERERGEVGRGGERRLEEIARFRGLGEERRGGSKLGGVTERLRQAFENIGSPGRIVDARGLGDALDEPRYAALVSDAVCS